MWSSSNNPFSTPKYVTDTTNQGQQGICYQETPSQQSDQSTMVGEKYRNNTIESDKPSFNGNLKRRDN